MEPPWEVETRIYVYETLAPNRYEPSIEALNFRGDQGRCERRIFLLELIKNGGSDRGVSGWGVGVRVDVNREVKFLRK